MRSLPPVAAACAALLAASCSSQAPRQPVRTFTMGEKVTAGQIIYTVFETQWMTQIVREPTPRFPKSRFFVVRISAVNSGAEDLLVPNLTIEDDQGNSYAELTDGTGVPQWIGYLRSVKPAEAAQGNIVFDAPPKHYKLQLTDENGELRGSVDIPLSFGAETPEIPLPGAPKSR